MPDFLKKLVLTITFTMIFINGHAKGVLEDLDGQKISLKSLEGKWVVINVWAPWCQPCLDEIPMLNKLAENKNVALYGINFDPSSIEEQKFQAQDLNISYPMLKRDAIDELNLGDINGVPAMFIYNPKGKLAYKLYGKQSLAKLNRLVKNA